MSVVHVTAGRGPVEVRRFVDDLGAWLVDRLPGASLRRGHGSVQVAVDDVDLGAWVGTHVLVDPVRGRGQRRRWFLALSLHETVALDPFRPEWVRFRADRAGGPGGQGVNTTSSAVRAVYPPTGEAVRVTSERSQQQNRARALALLAARHEARRSDVDRQQVTQRWRAHDRVERGDPVARWRRRRGRLEPVVAPAVAGWFP